MPTITPNLWFDTDGLEAAEFYCSVFPNSRVTRVTPYAADADPQRAGQVMFVEFELDGQPHAAINGGPQFTFSEAVSLEVRTKDQAETDRYWEALSAGGEEGPCGWCKDRFGLSWQIVPEAVLALTTDPDEARRGRAMRAMYDMKKLDVAAMQAAADTEAVPAGA